jgi:hypothetical protein
MSAPRLKNMPPSVRRAVSEQYPELAMGLPSPGHVTSRRYDWAHVARSLRATLPIGAEPLRLWFPGLLLKSVNAMIGSGRKKSQEGSKRESQAAVMSIKRSVELWRFAGRVDIRVTQYVRASTHIIDSDNLHAKALIDALSYASGIGIIQNDDPRYVRWVCKRSEVDPGHDQGVMVEIVPVEEVGHGGV